MKRFDLAILFTEEREDAPTVGPFVKEVTLASQPRRGDVIQVRTAEHNLQAEYWHQTFFEDGSSALDAVVDDYELTQELWDALLAAGYQYYGQEGIRETLAVKNKCCENPNCGNCKKPPVEPKKGLPN